LSLPPLIEWQVAFSTWADMPVPARPKLSTD
jgi:hypothetical protein